jgi:hypothetical protein
MTVVGEGSEGIETGTILVDRGAVEHVAPGYSDASGGDQVVGNSDFVDDNMPTVDEVRDGFDSQTWEEKADNFASQANRAFTEMWLRNELRGEKSPIQSDYSATKSHEVMSEVNELFQTSHESWLDDAERVATTYPELTGAYLDMMEPSDAVKGRFKKIDGVTLDTE